MARITGELADLAEAAARDAHRLLGNARRALRRAQAKAAQLAGRARIPPRAPAGRLARAVGDLSGLLEATTRIIGQTRQRIAGTTPDGATRVVSLHDRDARPIAKGRLGKPVEFGYKGRSSTTTTASSWITSCMPETPPMHHNWPRRSSGSKPAPVAHPDRDR